MKVPVVAMITPWSELFLLTFGDAFFLCCCCNGWPLIGSRSSSNRSSSMRAVYSVGQTGNLRLVGGILVWTGVVVCEEKKMRAAMAREGFY